MRFTETSDADPVLLITNANPFLLFEGGSMLAIPWDQVDLTVGENLISDLNARAFDLPSFAAGFDLADATGLVSVRLSEDARIRQHEDSVYLIDLSDPMDPVASTRGTDSSDSVVVQSDPVDVVVDPETRFAFVANRTSHTVSVLDTSDQSIEVVLPWPEYAISSSTFTDEDESGSTGDVVDIETIEDETDLITDDSWTLTWIEGTYRVWMPGADGLSRSTTTGDNEYEQSNVGVELAVEDSDGLVSEISDPYFMATSPGRMFFTNDGSIRAAQTDDYLADWMFEVSPILSGSDGNWDETMGGPSVMITEDGYWLFYDGTQANDSVASAIGAAFSDDGIAWSRVGQPLLEPSHDHESDGMADPYVVYDAETDLFHLFYGAFDGTNWTIGHAISEDLSTWETDEEPIFAIEDGHAAAPAVFYDVGNWHMWYARQDDGVWGVGESVSSDGMQWTDLGRILEFEDAVDSDTGDTGDASWTDDDNPPGPAIHGYPEASFSIEGENHGHLGDPVIPGETYSMEQILGWELVTAAGYWLGTGDAGSQSNGGIRIDSMDEDAGLAWLTLTSTGGTQRIGVGNIEEDGTLSPVQGAVFEGSSGFDKDGAGSPVVVRRGSGWVMYYAGYRNSSASIGMATSSDGLSWTPLDKVLEPGDEWDARSTIPGSIESLGDGVFRLWYSGFDGEVWRIGSALSSDGQTFAKEEGEKAYQFGAGTPGDWDDSGVKDPWIVAGTNADGDSGTHLWYAGFDGDVWQGGYAFRADGQDDFIRTETLDTEEARPALLSWRGLFHPDGVVRPMLWEQDDGTWMGWFAGILDDITRVGRVAGDAPDRLRKLPLRPTVGDTLTFQTEKGDEETTAIPLDTFLPDASLSGLGISALQLDSDRGFLYATSKLLPYVVVLDIRDDTDEEAGFQDLNYLDVEAVITVNTSGGATGFRQVLPGPDDNLLYALNDSPEAVFVLDISELEDDEYPNLLYNSIVGWLPAPRGKESDVGVDTQMSIGPAQMVIHPDESRMFVTNFNANSISVYDLTLGPYGQWVAEVEQLGENPYAIVLTEDGNHAVFANYSGEVSPTGLALSTLGVLDIDEESPTYLEVITWITNQ